MIVSGTIIDEGASVSILSSTAWKVLGLPSLMPVTQNLLGFNKGTSWPLGILPKLSITLGRKTIRLNVMVVPGPLDYNLLLGHDYVYNMEAIISTLFWVMCFLHESKIVTVDQPSFPSSSIAPSRSSSLNGPCTLAVSLEPSFHRPNYCE